MSKRARDTYIATQESKTTQKVKAQQPKQLTSNQNNNRPIGANRQERTGPYTGRPTKAVTWQQPNDLFVKQTNLVREEVFIPLTKTPEYILQTLNGTNMIRQLPPPRRMPQGANQNKWCDFHRIIGHNTNKCHTLKREIEKLVTVGHLEQFLRVGYQSMRRRMILARPMGMWARFWAALPGGLLPSGYTH